MSCFVKTKSIFTSEGRIAVFEEEDDVLYKFEYKLKDHLGNTRVVFGGHTSGKVEHIQRTAYYPFGLVMDQQDYITFAGLNSRHAPFENKFLYNGKEWQNEEIGGVKLGWYDYGARFYDPALGRFHTVDPMAEMYSSYSPFTYVLNNPVKFIDPTGMWVETDTGYHTDDPDEIADWWEKNVGSGNQSDNNDSDDEESEKDENENSLKDSDLETTNTYTNLRRNLFYFEF